MDSLNPHFFENPVSVAHLSMWINEGGKGSFFQGLKEKEASEVFPAPRQD